MADAEATPPDLEFTPGEAKFLGLRKNAETVLVVLHRLSVDAQPQATATLFSTGPTYATNAPLRRSGLPGPVTIERYRPIP